jgi:hypothetical protein
MFFNQIRYEPTRFVEHKMRNVMSAWPWKIKLSKHCHQGQSKVRKAHLRKELPWVPLLCVVQVAASAMSWLLVRRSLADCVCVYVTVCALEPQQWGGLSPSWVLAPHENKIIQHYKRRCFKQVACVIQGNHRIIIACITPSFLCCLFTGCLWLTIACISHLHAWTIVCLYFIIPPQSFEEHVVPTFH